MLKLYMNLFKIIEKLYKFWEEKIESIPFFENNIIVGAGTFHPVCFFSSLKRQQNSFMGVQKCTRKADGRYGESPNRLASHHQFQVLIHNSDLDIVSLYKESLEYIGLKDKFIYFNENNWENISIGAIGVGSEVLCDNTEISQFTYFQKMADITLENRTVEVAYGLERILCCLNLSSIYDCKWSKNISYKEMRKEEEKQFSNYYFNFNKGSEKEFNEFISESNMLIEYNLYLPAYENLLKAIDIFNSMDAKKEISQINRKEYISITRKTANKIALNYLNNLN